jgi:uncharacterized protein (TIGR03083 family)
MRSGRDGVSASALGVSTRTGVSAGAGPVIEALATQRARLVLLCRELSEDEWRAPSRCVHWTVHEVVRHLVDPTDRIAKIARGEPTGETVFDPRTTPQRWLEETTGLTTPETVDALVATTESQLAAFDELMLDGDDRALPGPYGPIHWTTFALHVFWDSWLHERDVTLPLGLAHGAGAYENTLAALYGILLAGVPLGTSGATATETFMLDGVGGGGYRLDAAEETRTTTTDEIDVDALSGELAPVVDSLSGRDAELADVLDGPPERVARLGYVRAFMRS